ncbi:unnamed protein product [Urochloa humidicola]
MAAELSLPATLMWCRAALLLLLSFSGSGSGLCSDSGSGGLWRLAIFALGRCFWIPLMLVFGSLVLYWRWPIFFGSLEFVLAAADLVWWVRKSEEGDGSGDSPSSPARMLLMCLRVARYAIECPWCWPLQRFQDVELLDGKMDFSSFGGSGKLRRRSLKKTARKMGMDFNVILFFLRVFFANWGCTVLNI